MQSKRRTLPASPHPAPRRSAGRKPLRSPAPAPPPRRAADGRIAAAIVVFSGS